MASATDAQVQQYSDQRVRPRAEQFRALGNALADDKAAIDDVYAACAQATPTWADRRTDAPPRLLTPQDILNYNAAADLYLKFAAGTATAQDSANFAANLRALASACVRPAGSP